MVGEGVRREISGEGEGGVGWQRGCGGGRKKREVNGGVGKRGDRGSKKWLIGKKSIWVKGVVEGSREGTHLMSPVGGIGRTF